MKRHSSLALSLIFTAMVVATAAAQIPQTPAQPAPAPPQSSQPPPTAGAAAPGDATTSPGSLDTVATLDERAKHALAVQVALDRAGFSPGEIDAASGGNTERAWHAFQAARGVRAGPLKTASASALGDAFTNPVASYTISEEDAAGPFAEQLPEDMMEKSKLPALAYSSVLELLAERFHASPKLLQRLNPDAKFEPGDVILVPNVETFVVAAANGAPDATKTGQRQGADAAPAASTGEAAKSGGAMRAGGQGTRKTPAVGKQGAGKAAQASPEPVTVIVTDKTKTLQVQNAAGQTIFHAPVTVGSTNDPLPVGEWKVNGVKVNPPFNYNPQLFWDADPKHAKAKIAAGPNNPVGVVWIDLSKEHYGIHGTPEPGRVGYTESHGCIRLTNWDAMRVAALVQPGTKVVLR